MTRLYRKFLSLFRRPVVVQTYHIKPTNAEKKRREMTARLARERGVPNPLEKV